MTAQKCSPLHVSFFHRCLLRENGRAKQRLTAAAKTVAAGCGCGMAVEVVVEAAVAAAVTIRLTRPRGPPQTAGRTVSAWSVGTKLFSQTAPPFFPHCSASRDEKVTTAPPVYVTGFHTKPTFDLSNNRKRLSKAFIVTCPSKSVRQIPSAEKRLSIASGTVSAPPGEGRGRSGSGEGRGHDAPLL